MPVSRRTSLDVAEVAGQLDAVDDDAPGVVLLEAVDAADHRRLAGPRRADHDDDLLAGDLEVDVPQGGERPEALDHPGERSSSRRCRPLVASAKTPSGPLGCRRLIALLRVSVIGLPPPACSVAGFSRHRDAPDPEQQHDEHDRLAVRFWPRNSGCAVIGVDTPIRSSSPIAVPASVVSLNRQMNWPTIAGITLRSAWGSTQGRSAHRDRPSAWAASGWPRGTTAGRRGRSRRRTPAVNRVNTMIARFTCPGGRSPPAGRSRRRCRRAAAARTAERRGRSRCRRWRSRADDRQLGVLAEGEPGDAERDREP